MNTVPTSAPQMPLASIPAPEDGAPAPPPTIQADPDQDIDIDEAIRQQMEMDKEESQRLQSEAHQQLANQYIQEAERIRLIKETEGAERQHLADIRLAMGGENLDDEQLTPQPSDDEGSAPPSPKKKLHFKATIREHLPLSAIGEQMPIL